MDEERFERIRKAVEARDRFLAEHPELQPLQDEINRLTKNMDSPQNRMAVLDAMMQERIRELQHRLQELHAHLEARLENHGGEEADADDEPPGGILGPAVDWPRRGDDSS